MLRSKLANQFGDMFQFALGLVLLKSSAKKIGDFLGFDLKQHPV